MENSEQPATGKVPPKLPSVPLSSPPVLTQTNQSTPKSKLTWMLTPWIIVGVLLLGILMSSASRKGVFAPSNLNGKPEVQALKNLCALNLSSQASQAKALCTEQGLVIAQNTVDSDGRFNLATFKITSVKENPHLTDIQMVRDTADGTTVIAARMRDQNGWKFDDIYVAQANGREIKIWASDVMEHPITTALGLVDWNKAITTTSDIIDMCQKLKQTFGEDRSSRSE